MDTDKIFIVGADYETDTRDAGRDRRIHFKDISPEILKNGLLNVVNSISSVLEKIDENMESYRLEEISIALELTASGKIAIVGSGIDAGSKGGIQLKFQKEKLLQN